MREKKRTVQPIRRLGQHDDACTIANQWIPQINIWNYYYMEGHHTGRLLLSLLVGRHLEILSAILTFSGIPMAADMRVCRLGVFCVLAGRALRVGLITRPEEC